MKYILIKSCDDCPHRSHTGAFTKGGAKPSCNHPATVELKGNDVFKRIIPYKRESIDTVHFLCVPKSIPDWCPLPNFNA